MQKEVHKSDLWLFTLLDNETETDTDKTEPGENLHWLLSPSSTNTSTQFCKSHFISVSVFISVSGIVSTPLEVENMKSGLHFRIAIILN